MTIDTMLQQDMDPTQHSITVFGAGTMGLAIADLFVQNGYTVYLRDKDVDTARKNLEGSSYDRLKKEAIVDCTLEEAVSNSTVALDATTESIEVKRALFESLKDYRDNTIILTNSSTLGVNQLQQLVPDVVHGVMHFFGKDLFPPIEYSWRPELSVQGSRWMENFIGGLKHPRFDAFVGDWFVPFPTPQRALGHIANRAHAPFLIDCFHKAQDLGANTVQYITSAILGKGAFEVPHYLGMGIFEQVVGCMNAYRVGTSLKQLSLPGYLERMKAAGYDAPGQAWFRMGEGGLEVRNVHTFDFDSYPPQKIESIEEINKIESLPGKLNYLLTTDKKDAGVEFFYDTILPWMAYYLDGLDDFADSLEGLYASSRLGYQQYSVVEMLDGNVELLVKAMDSRDITPRWLKTLADSGQEKVFKVGEDNIITQYDFETGVVKTAAAPNRYAVAVDKLHKVIAFQQAQARQGAQ